MRLYESVFIARQDISPAQVEALTKEMGGIITDGGGTIHKHEYWGLRPLAYRIKKNRKGHYVMFNMEAAPDVMHEYDRKIRLNEDILRVLTIKIDAVDPEPSVIMQAKDERSDSRGEGGRGEGRRESRRKNKEKDKEDEE